MLGNYLRDWLLFGALGALGGGLLGYLLATITRPAG
jgi:hypothetical protein